MIRDLDVALRTLLRARMTSLGAGTPGGVAESQVGFAPPDSNWANAVTGMAPRRAINVYLADLRENRALRSNERLGTAGGASVPAPMRVDCHYLVSAWSPAADRYTRTLDEHAMLAEALQVLGGSLVLAVGGHDLPVAIVPPEGFAKLAEFWGTMGQSRPWKPAIPLVVTVPVAGEPTLAGPAVTTAYAEFRPDGDPVGAETRTMIAGVVRDAGTNPAVPVARAWVQLATTTGRALQAVRTDSAGEFRFADVVPGEYRVWVRAAEHDELADVPVTVPSATGHYDLEFP
ncbi:Pvc16 family protein [Actinoplanes sp. NPDC026623]|uniref:Pvc16 family protein n=1 Tax=Actinoplanes sp. NPDC026623 TaxID=3155610 RepID=UPI0034067D51